MSKLYEQVANQIRSKINLGEMKDEKGRFPCAASLAESFAISYPTILKALKKLASEGLVVLAQGRSPTLTCENFVQSSKKNEANLDRRIREEIQLGKWLSGSILPKQQLLAQSYAVSSPTIGRSLARLAKYGYVHKRGRSWIVGQQKNRVVESNKQRKTICILTVTPKAWKSFCTSARSFAFSHSLFTEAAKFSISVRHIPLYFDDLDETFSAKAFVTKLKLLGSYTLGYLLILNSTRQPLFSKTLSVLQKMKKPVVWVDRTGEVPCNIKQLSSGLTLHSVVFSQAQAVRTCLAFLMQHQHQQCAYLSLDFEAWSENRFMEIQLQVAGLKQKMNVIREGSLPIENGIYGYYAKLFPELCNIKLREDSGKIQPNSAFGRLVRCLVQIKNLLANSHISSLIVENDALAIVALKALALLNIKVPEDLSIISFDNSLGIDAYNLTSIDFGFGNMAYTTFHLLYGDLPLKPNIDGAYPAFCHVSDRGSVAFSRKAILN